MSNFDETVHKAIELAKSITAPDEEIQTVTLLATLIEVSYLKEKFPTLATHFHVPDVRYETETGRKTSTSVREVLENCYEEADPIDADTLFHNLLFQDEVTQNLTHNEQVYVEQTRIILERERFKSSPERKEMLRYLNRFGCFLDDPDIPEIDLCGREDMISDISRSLLKYYRNDVLLVGPEGIGKSALLKEFARRVITCHESIPRALYGAEIFQLSADSLTIGAVARPQFQQRILSLSEWLQKHPKVILLINPMDNIISKDSRRPEKEAAEESLLELIKTPVSVIGCVTPATKVIISGKSEWSNIFDEFRITEPDPVRLPQALMKLADNFARHYNGIQFTIEGLKRITEIASELNPERSEPRRSVEMMDDICAIALTQETPVVEIDAKAVEILMEESNKNRGIQLLRDPNEIYDKLSSKIIGQNSILRKMSDVLATRLSNWSDKERPRGVFLLGGPTGVGKTETAVQLAQILSGKPNNLIRINCNVLQSTGSQKTSIIWQLLGVPAGFVGHGEGGLLTPIMEKPNAVVLFDEFEKADPSVGKLLLQIIDTGLQEDNMGNTLDFRRSIILFTSNLGVDYGSKTKRIGFGDTKPKKSIPKVDEEKLRSELKLMGYGPEFLARVHEIFLYKSLDGEAISNILEIQIEKLKEIFKARKLNLIPKSDFTKTLATYYDPRNGVRGIINYLQTEVTAQMGKLDRMGKLKRISVVSLEMQTKDDDTAKEYSIDDDALTVFIKPPTN